MNQIPILQAFVLIVIFGKIIFFGLSWLDSLGFDSCRGKSGWSKLLSLLSGLYSIKISDMSLPGKLSTSSLSS